MDLQERSEKEKADNIFKNAQKKKMESKRSKNEEVAKDLISKVLFQIFEIKLFSLEIIQILNTIVSISKFILILGERSSSG